ncbi:hypothetical protein MBANPS3_009097 [Mucor bainieri]
MKLRAIKIRPPGITKEEEYKLELGRAATSPIMFDEPSTSEATVKQEDNREQKDMLQQDDDLGENYNQYRCNICSSEMPNLMSVLVHRHFIHNVKLMGRKKIKYYEEEPDIHAPNFYCKSCEIYYVTQNAYRYHLKYAHFMILKPLSNWKIPRNNIVPDIDDPNLYCRACDRTYTSRQGYRSHCRYIHAVKPVESASQSSRASNTPDTYCQICDRRSKSMTSYRQHLLSVHKIDFRTMQRERRDVSPDVNDPDFYCRSCEKKMATKYTYKKHLKLVHAIFPSASRNESGLNPDIDDPNHHCHACQKTYASNAAYRGHLRLIHRMILPPLKVNDNLTNLPDPYNSDYYCNVCNKQYPSLALYRDHCRKSHFMQLNHFSIVNPNAEINIHDPDFYCAQCARQFASKPNFKSHLDRVHHL